MRICGQWVKRGGGGDGRDTKPKCPKTLTANPPKNIWPTETKISPVSERKVAGPLRMRMHAVPPPLPPKPQGDLPWEAVDAVAKVYKGLDGAAGPRPAQ